jgi:hypothetical protein
LNIWLYHINPKSGWTYGWDIEDPQTMLQSSDREWPAGNYFRELAIGDILCVYQKNIPPNPPGVYVAGKVVAVSVPAHTFRWRLDQKRSTRFLAAPIGPDVIRKFFPRSYGASLQRLPKAKQKAWLKILDSGETIPADDIEKILWDSTLRDTEKEQLIQARRGQVLFRKRVLHRWKQCPITGCCFQRLLRASHIKPWCDCSAAERVDGFNGLLLAPNIDAAFDAGLVSFDKNGRILFSKRLPPAEARCLGIDPKARLRLSDRHQSYLKYHREKHGFPA